MFEMGIVDHVVCFILATLRIVLSIVGFDFNNLPLSRRLSMLWGEEKTGLFHKTGLMICCGYVLLYSPTVLWAFIKN